MNPLRDEAVALTAQAKLALGRGDLNTAKAFVDRANSLRVPESAFASGQLRPWQVAMEIDRAQRSRGGNANTIRDNSVVTAGALMLVGQSQQASGQATPANAANPPAALQAANGAGAAKQFNAGPFANNGAQVVTAAANGAGNPMQ